MINTGKLAGRTLFITGASRGIGKAIALKAARDGANIVIAAKTAEPHPKLPGTIFTAAQEVEAAGGKALPCVVDVRDEAQVQKAVQQAVDKFGGIDIVVNNASAISLTGTAETEMKRYDLMQNINTRGTYLVSKTCLPHLKTSNHAHILNLSPPLNMKPHWFANHVAYTIAKYGMSMCALGMADEFKPYNISVNALWPRTAIQTAAIEMLAGPESLHHSRKPEIMADAAYHILSSTPPSITGQFLIDDEVLAQAGITDFEQYRSDPSSKEPLMQDAFLDDVQPGLGSWKPESKPSKQTDGKPDGKVAVLFSKIETTLNPELADKTQALYEFVVTGDEAGKWYIDLRPGNTATGKGEPPSKPDATLTMDSKHFFEMFGGKLKPATAYMTGKMKIAGNLQKALKLEKLMKGLKSKL